MEPIFNKKGRELLDTVGTLWPLPILLLGDTGWGKSVLVREVVRRRGLSYSSINGYPGMDIARLVGLWRPEPLNNGVTVVWQDGVLTKAIREGRAFLFEEMTRAPQDAIGRLFGLLDHGFRYWNVPEAGEYTVDVHPNFWFIATANPVGSSYRTTRLDSALQSRFAAVLPVDEPIADEYKVLCSLVSDSDARCLLNVVTECRSRGFNVPTRDLVLAANNIRLGLTAKTAIAVAIGNKAPESAAILGNAEVRHYALA